MAGHVQRIPSEPAAEDAMTEAMEERVTKTHPGTPAGQLETVGERLQRLESELAQLRDPTAIEQAVAARVMANLHEQAHTAANGSPYGMATIDNSGVGGLVPSALMTAVAGHVVGHAANPSFWLRLGIFGEFRLMFKMYFDARYRLSRLAQFAVPILLLLIVGNYFAFAFWSVPILAPIFERVFLVIFAVALYKVLSREAARYAEVLRYLAAFGR